MRLITILIGIILAAIFVVGIIKAKNKQSIEFVNYVPTLLTATGILGAILEMLSAVTSMLIRRKTNKDWTALKK